ncbi:MAG: hypothetical protein R2693_02620 [Nocardioidaceae bacterium]
MRSTPQPWPTRSRSWAERIRRALAPLARHSVIPVYDADDITVTDQDLEAAQTALAQRTAELLDQHRLVAHRWWP